MGFAAAKSAVNQRAMEASRKATIAAAPSRNTISMRGFQISSVPILAAVLRSTRRFRRPPAWMPSHWPIKPPMDSPQKMRTLNIQCVQQRQHITAELLDAVRALR